MIVAFSYRKTWDRHKVICASVKVSFESKLGIFVGIYRSVAKRQTIAAGRRYGNQAHIRTSGLRTD